MGGLSEKANIFEKLRNDTKGRDIVVDAGNSLFAKKGRFKAESAELINARAIAEIFLLLGFDALAVGSDDLSGGLELLRETADQGLPWISANLYGSDDRPVFAPFIVKEIDNLSVAIVGLTGPEPLQSADFVIKDGASMLADLLPELDSQHDLILVLAAMKISDITALAEKFPQIDIVAAADRGRQNVIPFLSGTTLITQTGTRGRYQGLLTIDWNGSPLGKKISDELRSSRKRLESNSQRLERLQTNPWDAASKTQEIKKLQANKTNLEVKIEALERQLAAGEDNPQVSTFEHRFLPLAGTGRKNPQIDSIIRDAQKRMATTKLR